MLGYELYELTQGLNAACRDGSPKPTCCLCRLSIPKRKTNTGKQKEIRQGTHTSGPQPSRGCVQMSRLSRGRSVRSMWKKTYKSGRDVPDVAPKPSPGHFRGIPTTKYLYVFFVYQFSSPCSCRRNPPPKPTHLNKKSCLRKHTRNCLRKLSLFTL